MEKKKSETRAEFFHVGMKARLGEGGGRILLGDNIGVGVFTLHHIGFQCAGVWI